MGLSDEDILEQYRMRKIEAAHEYEIGQIVNAGPGWKNVMLMQQGGAPEGGAGGPGGGMDFGGGGMDMGGDMDFGSGDMGGDDMGAPAEAEPADMDMENIEG